MVGVFESLVFLGLVFSGLVFSGLVFSGFVFSSFVFSSFVFAGFVFEGLLSWGLEEKDSQEAVEANGMPPPTDPSPKVAEKAKDLSERAFFWQKKQ